MSGCRLSTGEKSLGWKLLAELIAAFGFLGSRGCVEKFLELWLKSRLLSVVPDISSILSIMVCIKIYGLLGCIVCLII